MTITDVEPSGGINISGSSPVSFVHGGGQVGADIVVEWDFDNDGDFSESIENVTSFVMNAESMTGRDWPSQLTGKAGPGKLKLTLLNNDDRFSFFNGNSPLNQNGNSLRVGRKIRIRTAESVSDDPVLLVRDRFNRPDGALASTFTETGQQWQLSTGFAVQDNQAVATDDSNTVQFTSVAAGFLNHYVQAAIGPLTAQNSTYAGVMARRQNSSNYVFARLNTAGRFLQLGEVVAGVETVLATTPDPGVGRAIAWPGVTIGLNVQGLTATAFLNGVPLLEDTITSASGGLTGLVYLWNNNFFASAAPSFDDFHVWDNVVTETEGIIWTGDVTTVDASVMLGPLRIAAVEAEGRLARAALVDVVSPRSVFGSTTGVLVGDVLNRAGLLHPPGIIDEGTIMTGSVGVDDDKALTLGRKFEETEVGFLHEMPEGSIAFRDRAGVIGEPVAVGFSDAPGTQFGYSNIEMLDWRGEIVNRVTAGVAPDLPDGINLTVDLNSTGAATTNHVDVDIPALVGGTLVVVFIASTVAASGQGWNTPIWWGVRREFGTEDDDSIRTRVYTHFTGVDELAQTVRFFTAPTNIGGAWVAHIYTIEDWFQATSRGITDKIEFTPGDRASALVTGWGRIPTLYFAVNAGLTSLNGGSVSDAERAPLGYDNRQLNFINGAVNGFDVGLHTAFKFSVNESDDPSSFGGFEGFAFNESALFAVRGFNGSHVVLPTIQNPSQFEESPGRFVTVDDVGSQDEIGVVRSHAEPSNLFASEDDADGYADAVIATYSDDRPLPSITFPATINAAYRAQAFRRRVGDKIVLTANNETGMGINGEYIIENIVNRWSDGGVIWDVTWELSPG